ncbi:MAG: MATE family efflux transporter [Clostridia bacterium]|nr:MATE family efflux transporter [Clostridia bacterium]
MKKKIDATKGPLVRLIFVYTIPLILSTIMQHLFEIVDKAVLGHMADTAAVASVGATSAITSLIINGFVGLSTGTSIVLARYIGQKNKEKIRTTIDTSLISGVGFGIVVAMLGILLAPVFLNLTNCPAECYEGALIYVRIYIAAAPATLLYNYGSAVLRTLGDTKRPLYYIIVAGVVNVVLNVILCLILPQKVAAVAIATAASKIIGSVLVVNRLCHFEDGARVNLRRLKFTFSALGGILKFGVPTSISNLVYPLANLQITSAVNSFGIDAVAGNSASGSIANMAHAITGGFGTAATTFMGQNIGAEQPSRVRRSLLWCFVFSVGIGGAVGLAVHLTGEFWTGLIVGFSSTKAIEYAMVRSFWVTQLMFINGANAVSSHALQAYGYPVFTSINSIVFTLGFRVLWMQVFYPMNPTFNMVMMCFAVSWTLILAFNSVAVAIVTHRYNKGIYKKI